MNFLLVGLGASAGAMLRYGISLLLVTKNFPWSTVAINLSGSFLLGCVAAYLGKEHPTRLLLGIGFLGGYTTYSTYALDVFEQLQKGEYSPAIANIILQSCGSICVCGFGFALISKMTK